jgi:phospho-N-acetylmuramoyl-pentapeptide-transferase
MLFFLGQSLEPYFGPFRLLTSHLFLIVAGTSLSFVATLVLLPRFFDALPRDRGRSFAVASAASVGKPTGAGVVFITLYALISVLVVPWDFRQLMVLALTVAAMVSGYLDDRSDEPWNEYLKGFLDLGISVAAAFLLYEDGKHIWLPFTAREFDVSIFVFVPLATVLIWASINSTNCTDGVDGLSSTLLLLALISLAAFLYLIIGIDYIAEYLLLPFYPNSASWAIMTFVLVGALAAYLWHNAHPSTVLMGDAGSRALGFFLGVLVILSGNPFVIVIVATVMLVNGGTGLLKVALLRFAKIRIFHNVRFPLHDYFRHEKGWSNSQVLIRFALIQILLVIVLFGLFIKVR